MYTDGFKNLKKGDHVLAIFHEEDQSNYALDFVKAGLDNNERVILMIDSLSKEEIRNRIRKDEDIKNFDELEAKKQILIKTSDEMIRWENLHKEKSDFWRHLTKQAIENENSGLRIFIDTAGFFKKGTINELIHFESLLEKNFDFPCIVICVYTIKNVKSLNSKQNRSLIDHHKSMWI